jgi:hypothetical protein
MLMDDIQWPTKPDDGTRDEPGVVARIGMQCNHMGHDID